MSGRDDELEELREEKIEQLRERKQQEAQQEQAQERAQQAEAQKEALLRQYLTDGARQRLNSVRMSKPQFAEKVEQQLVALAQSGRLGQKIDEDQMKELLSEMSPDSKSFNIRRR